MNILHFTHSHIPVYGGTTTRHLNLFRNDGNFHTFVVPSLKSKYVPREITTLERESTYDNAAVLRVDLSPASKLSNHLMECINCVRSWKTNARQLVDVVPDRAYDLVYGHNPMEFAEAARLFSIGKDLPMVYEIHGLFKDTLDFSGSFWRHAYYSLGHMLVESVEKAVLRHADVIVAQTSKMKQRVVGEFGVPEDKIRIISNGVDIERFSRPGFPIEIDRLRREKSIGNKVVVSYFGFLDENNGIRFLLGALARLPDYVKDELKVLVAGRGPYEEEVKRFALEHCFLEYLGLVAYEEIVKFYGLTDVFVIPRPSNRATETLVPVKLLEAMAMRNIVLVSQVGGLTEIVSDGINGVVFKVGDEGDLVRKLTDIIERRTPIDMIRENARKYILERHTWQKARLGLKGIFEGLMNKPRLA